MTGQQKHIANAHQSYTMASRTSQRTDQSLPKSMPAPTQEKYEVFTNTFDNKNDVSKIQNIFSCPLKKLKHPTHRPTRQRHGNSTTPMVYKDSQQNTSCQQRVPQLAVPWKIEAECSACPASSPAGDDAKARAFNRIVPLEIRYVTITAFAGEEHRQRRECKIQISNLYLQPVKNPSHLPPEDGDTARKNDSKGNLTKKNNATAFCRSGASSN